MQIHRGSGYPFKRSCGKWYVWKSDQSITCHILQCLHPFESASQSTISFRRKHSQVKVYRFFLGIRITCTYPVFITQRMSQTKSKATEQNKSTMYNCTAEHNVHKTTIYSTTQCNRKQLQHKTSTTKQNNTTQQNNYNTTHNNHNTTQLQLYASMVSYAFMFRPFAHM